MLLEVFNDVAAELTATGLRVVTDPRNVRPPCVLLQAPRFSVRTDTIREIQVTATVIAPGPGNLDALEAILELADTILDLKSVNATDGQPSTLTVGQQEYPAYEINLRVLAR